MTGLAVVTVNQPCGRLHLQGGAQLCTTDPCRISSTAPVAGLLIDMLPTFFIVSVSANRPSLNAWGDAHG